MSKTVPNANELLKGAHKEGDLSAARGAMSEALGKTTPARPGSGLRR